MKFYIGMRSVGVAWAFPRVMISITTLMDRWQSFRVNNWLLDSGAFTQLTTHGKFQMTPKGYAAAIRQWQHSGNLVGAMAQDWMCDPYVRQRTGKSVEEHQDLTIVNYGELRPLVNGVRLIPALQGWRSQDFVRHIRAYGSMLRKGAWVGVGSLCGRSSDPIQMRRILEAIKSERSDLQLHGFGIKLKSLGCPHVRSMLYSSDSISWTNTGKFDSWNTYRDTNGDLKAAKRAAELRHDPREALRYAIQVQKLTGEDELISWWKK
jgi:hypothetical protein